MKNTIIDPDLREINEFIYKDYTSRNYKTILNIPEIYDTEYVDFVTINVNQTMEQVSYNLYGSADYWDILVLINDRDPLFDMPYDFDILTTLAQAKIDKYRENYSGVFNQVTMDSLQANLLTKLEAESDSFRTIKIIRSNKLASFLKIYRETNINV